MMRYGCSTCTILALLPFAMHILLMLVAETVLSTRAHPSGGCFWGVELAFQRVPGVVKTSVGYTAGQDTSPTYNSVCSGRTGHTEAVQVNYSMQHITS